MILQPLRNRPLDGSIFLAAIDHCLLPGNEVATLTDIDKGRKKKRKWALTNISTPSAIIVCKFEVLLEKPAIVYSREWSNDLENSPCDCENIDYSSHNREVLQVFLDQYLHLKKGDYMNTWSERRLAYLLWSMHLGGNRRAVKKHN